MTVSTRYVVAVDQQSGPQYGSVESQSESQMPLSTVHLRTRDGKLPPPKLFTNLPVALSITANPPLPTAKTWVPSSEAPSREGMTAEKGSWTTKTLLAV